MESAIACLNETESEIEDRCQLGGAEGLYSDCRGNLSIGKSQGKNRESCTFTTMKMETPSSLDEFRTSNFIVRVSKCVSEFNPL